MSTVPPWAQKDIDGFSARYALVHELQAQILDDEVIEIADQTDAAAIRAGRSAEMVGGECVPIGRSGCRCLIGIAPTGRGAYCATRSPCCAQRPGLIVAAFAWPSAIVNDTRV